MIAKDRESPRRRATMERLDGGITLAIQVVDAPVTSSYLWFDVGSVDEPDPLQGAAHFVEHLLFKGTDQRPVGAVAAEIEGLGGDLNAWTSFDETCLHATVAPDGQGQALAVLFDMARRSTFDPGELERERQVVLEELKDGDNDPESVTLDRVWARTFADHPYGRPVIGSETSVRAMDREAIVAFHRRHYAPDRAILGIVGPVDRAAVREQVRELCRGWAPGGSRTAVPTAAAAPSGSEVLHHDFATALIHLAWPGPPVGHPDAAALDVLAHSLGGSSASRLALSLELDAGVAIGPWAQHTPLIGAGLFSVGLVALDTAAALSLALTEIARVARGGVSVDGIARSVRGVLADLMFGLETTDGMAEHLVASVARHGDPGALQRYRDQVAAVTVADVRRVAARWLDDGHRQIVVLDPDLSADALRSVVASAQLPPPHPGTANPIADKPRSTSSARCGSRCWPRTPRSSGSGSSASAASGSRTSAPRATPRPGPVPWSGDGIGRRGLVRTTHR